jgi:hypothetical protein
MDGWAVTKLTMLVNRVVNDQMGTHGTRPSAYGATGKPDQTTFLLKAMKSLRTAINPAKSDYTKKQNSRWMTPAAWKVL